MTPKNRSPDIVPQFVEQVKTVIDEYGMMSERA